MDMNLCDRIAHKLGISVVYEDKILSIKCPFHPDTRASAGINFVRKFFICFASCGNKSFKKLAEDLGILSKDSINGIGVLDYESVEDIISSIIPTREVSIKKQIDEYSKFLFERKINPKVIEEFHGYYETDKDSNDYGYLCIPYDNGKFVKRRIIDGAGERFILSKGEGKGLLYKDRREIKSFKNLVLVEGCTDLFCLYQSGMYNVLSTLTANVSEQQMYELRGKVVFIVFDKDYAGYKGAIKAKEFLKQLGSIPIILEIPEELESSKEKTDINSSYLEHGNKTIDWIEESIKDYSAYDTSFVTKFINNVSNVIYIETGIRGIDKILGGGFSTGFHVFTGREKIGKSTFVTALIDTFLTETSNKKVLLITYELPKEQMYARIASCYDTHSWKEIEKDHTVLSDTAKYNLTRISDRLRIEKNWSIEQIKAASDNFDIIFIDFLQRMPYEGDIRTGVSKNAKELNNLCDKGKIVIAISSMTESSDFKESGDIKYVIQSGWKLMKLTDDILECECIYNTGGELGKLWLKTDYKNQKIKEVGMPNLAEYIENKGEPYEKKLQ